LSSSPGTVCPSQSVMKWVTNDFVHAVTCLYICACLLVLLFFFSSLRSETNDAFHSVHNGHALPCSQVLEQGDFGRLCGNGPGRLPLGRGAEE
jgi:hypothetical protein